MEEFTVPVKDNEISFKIYLLELTEWEVLPQLFPLDEAVFQTQWFKQIHPIANLANASTRDRTSKVRPGVMRLRPGFHHVLFSDRDRQEKEHPIRFFLTKDVLVIVGYPLLRKEKVLEWANRGIIDSPMDLVQIIGIRVLRHHQTRLESIENQMDQLEEEILNQINSSQQSKIIVLHRSVMGLKKSLNNHLTAFERLGRIDTSSSSPWPELITESERELENIRQAHERMESLREAYQAAVDIRANDIMKLLSILATVLLPITLLTSFFGMNFEHMPLIRNYYGLYIFYAIGFLIIIVVLIYFWKKDWLR
ncbi:magnesium transporter CorA family protein [Desulfitobacterium metallireducens]|uniref:Magnesium transporter n=1 Tax=Desulfitobacterium metallireducens DSM 15288 TaxID=871968 RepID=W0E988_9FIRM|nr:CorA family divalent cation transporter [Desulfitobacterium metallireducens]AHF07317.1 magnesium transporter [Desulfitobacterium metallireducens DSM 15288]